MLNKLFELIKSPVFPDDEETTRRARALNALYLNIFIVIFLGGGAGVLFAFNETLITSMILALAMSGTILGLFLIRRGWIKFSGYLLLSTIWLLTTVTVIYSGGIHSYDVMFYVSGTVIAGIALGTSGALYYGVASLSIALLLLFLQASGVMFPQIFTLSPFSAWLLLLINIGLTLIPLQVVMKDLSDSAMRTRVSEERFRMIASVISDYAYYIRYDQNENILEQWMTGAFESITGFTPHEYFERGGWLTILHPDDRVQDEKDMNQLRANQKVITEVRVIRKDGEVRWVRSYAKPVWDEKTNRLAGLHGAVQDITARKMIENSLRQREAILDAVAISAETLFKSSNWRGELENVLEFLGKSINASHAYLFENTMESNDQIYTTIISEWTASGYASDMDNPKYQKLLMSEDDLASWYQMMKSGQAYIGDKASLDQIDYDYLIERGIKALLDVPIFINNQWWGTLGFDDMSVARKWTNAEVDALKVAGSVIAAAIKRQMDEEALHNELIQRRSLILELEHRNAVSETLHESAAIVVATLEQSEAIARILEQLEKVINFDSASVQLLKSNMLEIVSARGFDIKEVQKNQFIVNEEEPSYPIVRGGAPYTLLDDAQASNHRFNQTPHHKIRGWMAVPLKVKDKVIGVITMDGSKPAQFNENDAKLAVAYANQVAIAIENSRLFNEVQVELKVRKKLIEELEAKNAELERFTYTVSHDLRSPLVTIKGYLGYIEKNANSGNFEVLHKDVARISVAADRMEALLKDLLELSRIGRLVNKPQDVPFSEIVNEALENVHGRLEQNKITLQIHPNLPIVHGDKPRLIEVLQNLIDNAAKHMGDQKNPVIEIGVENEAGTPVFFVRDNGMGIHPDYHQRIFGLFEKLDSSSDGTGIGLALVKRIIEFHGGQIWVESTMGKGSTFFFTIPNITQ